MPRYKIIFKREVCIGASSCAAAAPDQWVLEDDGKAMPKKARKTAENEYVVEIDEKKLKENLSAAQNCPVNAIHVINLDTGEKLI